jgi:2-polyprenyl-3-methyl-5-hydroxy-6-metoxy-1,4-benzoquinol methylase/GNAT superfamily N-acetyltransferase
MNIKYEKQPGNWVVTNEVLLNDMSYLYSSNYGIWGKVAQFNKGKNIKLSVDKLKSWLTENTEVVLAYDGDILIGYAVVILKKVHKNGPVAWISQFVVHKEFRNRGIGTNLLSYWGFSNFFAWGLISANPYAIRALEKISRRRCSAYFIQYKYQLLIKNFFSDLPYVDENTDILVSKTESKINTKFFLDHSELETMLTTVISEKKPWLLGKIDEGWEWFAFTFQSQDQIMLLTEEITRLLDTSDKLVKEAYSRMELTSNQQKWMNHTDNEIEYILEKCQLTDKTNLLDFGCGIGRHSIKLAEKVNSITGIDYLQNFIDLAKSETEKLNLKKLTFLVEDCRSFKSNIKYDTILCLYDVIGSYADNKQNIEIIKNIFNNLKEGGHAVISVMNYNYKSRLKAKSFDFTKDPNEILKITPSSTMEKSGDVFNPEFFIYDPNTRIFYRKEQFTKGTKLPIELIIRDRRFIKKEIIEMCKSIGFKIIETKFVRSGKWNMDNLLEDESKEVLLLCQK